MDDRYSPDGPPQGPLSSSSTARDSFNRFRDSVPGRVSSLQDRVSSFQGSLQGQLSTLPDRFPQVADKLYTIPNKLQGLPDKFQERFANPNQAPPVPARSLNSSPLPVPSASPPPPTLLKVPSMSDPAYDPNLAALAGKILYRSGIDPESGGPLLILCAASFPDARAVDYNKLLPYVLSVLPGDEELGAEEDGGGYSVVFFSGGGALPGTSDAEGGGSGGYRPSWSWTLQAYHLVHSFISSFHLEGEEDPDQPEQLGRAVRKRIRKLWVVHEKAWVRIIFEMMASVVSPKFRKKVVHLNSLSDLALQLDITTLLIPPAVYLHDRKLSPAIIIPFPSPPIFSSPAFHTSVNPPRVGENMPLPQVLVDTSRYIRSSCLSVEGLFRVPPSAVLLDILREAVDRGQRFKWDEWSPHTAAALIKLYYRSLPEPLFPRESYEILASLKGGTEGEEKTDDDVFPTIRMLLDSEEKGLPKSSRVLLLKHLLPLLALVAQNSAVNKMTSMNLAVCVTGSLLRSDDMIADAKASSGVRRFLEVAIDRIEELAPKLPNRNSTSGRPNSYSSDMGQLGDGIKPPTPTTSPPPYTSGKVQRKKVPNREGDGGVVVSRKLVLGGSKSSIDVQDPVSSEDPKALAILTPPPMVYRRGSVPSPSPVASTISTTAPSTMVLGSEEGQEGIVLRRKASLQALAVGDTEATGTLSKGPSSLSPHPSPSFMTQSLSVSSPVSPRVVRRAISSSYLPSSSSLFSPSYSPASPSPSSSSNVAAIANSLNRAQFNPSLSPNSAIPPTASPMVRARTESIIGNRSRAGTSASMVERTIPIVGSGVVEELRTLYEERAKGVEVLVRSGVRGSVKGRWKEQ